MMAYFEIFRFNCGSSPTSCVEPRLVDDGRDMMSVSLSHLSNHISFGSLISNRFRLVIETCSKVEAGPYIS